MKTLRWLLLTLALVILVAPLFALLATPEVWAEDPAGGGSPEERVLREAITALGWPDTITRKPLYQLDPDDDTLFMLWPPASAVRYFLKQKYSATNGGSSDEETIQYARILALGEDGGRLYVDKMVENGFRHSSYQGREGVAVRTGDELCDPGGLLGFLVEIIRDFFEQIFGESADSCPYASAGYIAWTCGSHTFVARDDTGQGGEDNIAAALYMAAQRQGLCDLGDTLVILAGTDDVPGARPLSHYEKMGQDVNSYFGVNSFGKVALSYTYMDADGDAGSQDWYSVGPSMAGFAGKERDFAIAAVKKAFEAGAPREELELARVIVVYPGSSSQAAGGAAAPLSTLCSWPQNRMWHEIEVGPPDARAKVFASNLIVVAENDGLGLWAHEVAHTLYSRYLSDRKWYRIQDRYNYEQPSGKYGSVDNWGLMDSGNWWGDPKASNPVQMCSYTKESAEYLSYTDAVLGQKYTLTALENQKLGDMVLRVDDPTSAHPENYFIVEARQAGGWYGAPESGVVLYQVIWDTPYAQHVVNAITPQSGATTGAGPAGRSYFRPTFHAGSPTMQWPWAKLEFVLHSESTANGYSAVVSTQVYTPANLVGTVVAPAAVPAPPAPPTVTANFDGPLPDIDLHAYNDQGRHVGLNYQTGQYESQIPGAVFSGDLKDAPEWIYVPEGTTVRFEVSAYKTEQFLQANPQYRDEVKPHKFETTYQRFDEDGVMTQAKGPKGKVEAGEETKIKSPDDPSLKYRPAPQLHYGRNWPGDPYLVGLIGAILIMGLVGWVVALARR
jgi:M6 family metalloprotease-like protein